MSTVSIFAPAKLNLFLAITGRRADGFHDLVSLVAPLQFGDTLTVESIDALNAEEEARLVAERFVFSCSDPDVPTDSSNLVLRAAEAFVAATGWKGAVRFTLEKRIPMGAGLGGGSSDGVAALRAVNWLAGERLDRTAIATLAAQLGSDCPLFLHDGPVVMRGRGEQVSALPTAALARLRGRRVLVFKPAFGVPTAWAYSQLAAGAPASYIAAAEAEARIAQWLDDPQAKVEALLFNSMEPPAFAKFVALPTLLEQLQRDFGLAPRMSGSGSACFAFLPDGAPVAAITEAIRAAWGPSAFVVDTRIA